MIALFLRASVIRYPFGTLCCSLSLIVYWHVSTPHSFLFCIWLWLNTALSIVILNQHIRNVLNRN